MVGSRVMIALAGTASRQYVVRSENKADAILILLSKILDGKRNGGKCNNAANHSSEADVWIKCE